MIVDTHCHLDDERFENDIEDIIKRAKEFDVKKIVIPGANLKDLIKAKTLAKKHDGIYFACGVHPDYAKDYDENELIKFINDEKCIGVGECGLDYYRFDDKSQEEIKEIKKKQEEVFIAQINLAIKYNKALIVHIRDANEDAFNILKNYLPKIKATVLHCYNASPIHLELMKYGKVYYGIGGVLTFKNAKKLVEIVKEIPLENLVIETDAPYLTPEPFRGSKNEPSYTRFVVEKLSQILQKDEKIIKDITTKNALELFDIGDKC